MIIPNLLETGYLPYGEHRTTITEIGKVFGSKNVNRQWLFKIAKPGLENLFYAGATKIWIDGSFITSKAFPNDIDGIWEPGAQINIDLLDPVFFDHALTKEKFGLDFYLNGIEGGSGEPFTDFFQTSRDGLKKGILLLMKEDH